jgi:hypothetical protein
MGRIKTVFTLVLIFSTLVVYSQAKDSVRVRLNHYSFAIGAGWTHYFNNLDNGDGHIRTDFAGISAKFFWEPEYRLSLGLGTGYYKLFRIENQVSQDTSVQIDRSLVPFLLLVRMRVIDNVYVGAGMGISIITNKTSGAGQEIVTKMNSLANFELSGSYLYPLSKHWIVGGEMKVFYSGTLNDCIYSIQAVCAVKL